MYLLYSTAGNIHTYNRDLTWLVQHHTTTGLSTL